MVEWHKTITFPEMRERLTLLNANNMPIPFSVVFVTANRKERTGGEFVSIPYAIRHIDLKRRPGKSPNIDKLVLKKKAPIKDPNHYVNETTNLAILAKDEQTGKLVYTGKTVKVHHRLILFLDGKYIV